MIFIDCEMPIKDGYQATREIREIIRKDNLDDITIIGLTAHTGEENKKRCLEAGMTNVLSKPIPVKELRRLVKRFAVEEDESPE